MLRATGGDARAAQAATKVVPDIVDGITSYSGFSQTSANKHMFWWYFPPTDASVDAASAPTLVWLQGGPGGSSMFGLFAENGPIELVRDATTGDITAQARAVGSWGEKYGTLYIDNPVGAGFSYTTTPTAADGYCNNTKTCVAENLYALLQDFYATFPGLLKGGSELYVTGESYGGHYVPGISYYIHEQNAKTDAQLGAAGHVRVPFAGCAVGDGWIDPVLQLTGYAAQMFNVGLADDIQRAKIQSYTDRAIAYLKAGAMLKSFTVWDEMLNGDVFPYPNYFHNITGSNDYDNFMRTNAPASFGFYGTFVNTPAVRRQIHAGNQTNGINAHECELHLLEDFMVSFKQELGVLMDNYKVLIYSGQLDIIIGAPLTEAFLPTVPWSGQKAFAATQRAVWRRPEDADPVAGYVQELPNEGGGFAYAIVRGAGHIVPADQPKRAVDMITRFVEGKPFTK